MGAGKTSLGKKLASRIGWQHIDLDENVEKNMGLPVHEIFLQHGEEGFRLAEARELENLMVRDRVVVSTGGGTPSFMNGAEKMLGSGLCIWLTASPGLLAQRIRAAKHVRPLVSGVKSQGELADALDSILQVRWADYQRAHWHVETADLKLEWLVAQVKNLIPAQ